MKKQTNYSIDKYNLPMNVSLVGKETSYKQGYLDAINNVIELSNKTLNDHIAGDVLDFLVNIHKLKNKLST
jgi:hypothetical protein